MRCEAGQMDPVADVVFVGFGANGVPLGPFANDHQVPILGQMAECADQPRQVLDRAQTGERADPEFAFPLHHAAQSVRLRALGEGLGVDAVGDVLHPPDRLFPHLQCDPLERLRGYDEAVRAPERDLAKPVANGLEAFAFVFVEAVFVMDQRG